MKTSYCPEIIENKNNEVILIDINRVNRIHGVVYLLNGDGVQWKDAYLAEDLDDALAIDAIQVVRCRNCKFEIKHLRNGNVICRNKKNSNNDIIRLGDWFCADGKLGREI